MARSAGEVLLELLERVPDAATLEVLLEPANLAAILRAKGWQPDDIRADLRQRIPGELLLDVMRDEPDVDALLRLAGARRPEVAPRSPAAVPARGSPPRSTGLPARTLGQRVGGITVLTAATAPAMFVSGILPDAPRLGLAPALVIAAVGGVVGGWLFANGNASRLAGAVSGAIAAGGSIVTTWWWSGLHTPELRLELILSVAIGLVPGVLAYLFLTRAGRDERARCGR